MPNIIKSTQYSGILAAPVILTNTVIANTQTNSVAYSLDEARKQILDEAMDEAKKILASSRMYSEKVIADATLQAAEESKKIRTKSFEDGYQQGMEEGKAEGYQAGYMHGVEEAGQEQQKLLDEMNRLIESLEEQKAATLEKFSSDIQSLAFAIAQKVVKTEITTNEKAMAAIITNAIEAYRGQAYLKISISKRSADLLNSAEQPILPFLQEISDKVKILVYPELDDGDCIIDMPDQMIDAGTDTQLSKIKDALKI